MTYIIIMMWKVYEAKDVTRNLKKIPKQVQKKYKAWVETVKNSGSRNLKNFSGLKDEKLKGDLRECRSSRLNIQYRVVYTEDKKVKKVYVLKVTPHKYGEV